MAEQSRRRVVLFPCPFQGHINPMLQLATILHTHSKGALSIIIVHTEFNSPKASNYPDFTFLPISDGLSHSQSNISVSDIVTFLPFLNEICVSPFRDCLVNNILSQENEPPVACIISDALMYSTQAVADSLQLPRIALRTGSARNLAMFAAYPFLREKGYLPMKESAMEEQIPGFSPLKVKDIPVIRNADIDAMCDLIGSMINCTKASSALILNSCNSLEQSELVSLQKEFPFPHFAIGPFHKCSSMASSSLLVEDRSCISWLDKQAPASVIYISFGSIASVDEAQLVEIALGIANSEQSFLWVLRPGLVVKSNKDEDSDIDLTKLLPQKFKDMMELHLHSGRGCIVKWAPQQEVLAHPSVGAFWTHNGWNSTLESICEGVPMLCWPCFGDQMANARYVTEVWRVGFMLENGLEHGEIERYIRRLMVKEENTEREEMMTRVKDLKETTDLCLRNDGSSIKSLENLTDFIFAI
ncbi:hypothetical protein ACHQM5_004008 [Ranunculus cassubicifolius]